MTFFDCFAAQEFQGKFSCKALVKMDCDGCSFFKTKQQVEEERVKTKQRLKEIGR